MTEPISEQVEALAGHLARTFGATATTGYEVVISGGWYTRTVARVALEWMRERTAGQSAADGLDIIAERPSEHDHWTENGWGRVGYTHAHEGGDMPHEHPSNVEIAPSAPEKAADEKDISPDCRQGAHGRCHETYMGYQLCGCGCHGFLSADEKEADECPKCGGGMPACDLCGGQYETSEGREPSSGADAHEPTVPSPSEPEASVEDGELPVDPAKRALVERCVEALYDEFGIEDDWSKWRDADPDQVVGCVLKQAYAGPSVPDRSYIKHPAERAIQEAVDRVEEMGAHPLLTQIVVLLGEARAQVEDFIERPPGTEDCARRMTVASGTVHTCTLGRGHAGNHHDGDTGAGWDERFSDADAGADA